MQICPSIPSRRAPLSLGAALAACVVLVGGCATAPAPGSRSVTIERTTYGIAHVSAADDEGIGYGVGYAYAQDNLCQTAEQLLTLRGERTRYLGTDGSGELGLGRLPNPQIDLFIRAHMDDAALERAAATTGPELQAALRGYVAGYNRYLQDTPDAARPASCRGKPWVGPMTAADMRRATEQSMILGGLGAFAGAVLAAEPPAAPAQSSRAPTAPSGMPPPAVPLDAAVAELGGYRFNDNPQGSEFGSNGWAFGKNATPDGRGLVLGNPHFPWFGPNRFWEVHLTIPGRLDVMGTAGSMNPVVTIGFNHDVAWTHTVSTGKRFTLYELKLDPADPTAYLVDGRSKKMVAQRVEVPGTAVAKTFYTSDWGPLIAIPRAGLSWTATTAYALRDANTLNMRAGDAWMAMGRAKNIAELRAAMGRQAIPWVNTIAADRNGNAMYADLSVVPDVSAEQLKRCAPSPAAAALFAAAGLPVLDGSRSDCAWNRDPAAIAPGLLPAGRMPVVVTPDWVANSNDSYWLANPGIAPMADVSPLVGAIGTPQRLRTRSAILEIRGRLDGSDGLPGNHMGADELAQIIFRDTNLAGRLVMDDLVTACAAGVAAPVAATAGSAVLPADTATGCRVLAAWDRTANANSAGAPLFREFWRKARNIPKVWRVPFDASQPVTTPSGLDMATPATRDAVWKALADAVGIVRTAGFAPDVALGVPQSRVVHGERIALHGGDEFEGVLNKLETQGQPTIDAKGYAVNYGSSYLQIVGFDDRGPVARGILTYGQSSEPDAPHAFDQLPLFAAKRWLALPFHPADVAAAQIAPTLRLAY